MLRLTVRDDSRTDRHVRVSLRDHQRANHDVRIHPPVIAEIPNCTGVRMARHWFKFVDDLHATDLRAAGNGASREHRGEQVDCVFPRHELSDNVAHDVVYVRVAFEHHELVRVDGTVPTHAAKIVSFEVDEHDVFGALLRAE